MPNGQPSQLANLRPIPPEHRKVNPRKGTGHKARIRMYMQGQSEGEYNGQTIRLTDEEWITIKAIQDAKAGNFRARDFLFNRLYGKPQENIRLSGSIGTESPEEQRAKLEARKQQILNGERKIEVQDAQFTDISEQKEQISPAQIRGQDFEPEHNEQIQPE